MYDLICQSTLPAETSSLSFEQNFWHSQMEGVTARIVNKKVLKNVDVLTLGECLN
jgi:hypothetical protein